MQLEPESPHGQPRSGRGVLRQPDLNAQARLGSISLFHAAKAVAPTPRGAVRSQDEKQFDYRVNLWIILSRIFVALSPITEPMKTEVQPSAVVPFHLPGQFVRSSDRPLCLVSLTLAGLALALFGPGVSSAAAALVVSPSDGVVASGYSGGPFSGSPKVYTLSNDGGAELFWTAASDAPWVSLSVTGGALSGGQSTNLTANLNALALEFTPSAQATTLRFFSSAGGSTTRSVDLNIVLPGSATWEYPNLPVTDSFRLSITGGGAINSEFQVRSATNAAGPWTSIYTNTFSSTTGVYDFVANEARRFFRVWSSQSATLSIGQRVVQNLSEVIVRGSPYGIYELEASLDGSTWTPVYTNRTSVDGTFLYANSNTNVINWRPNPLGNPVKPVLDHVLILGESLAIALDGGPPLSTVPSTQNFRFYADHSTTNLSPLTEGGAETIASGAANHISATTPGRRVVMSNVGSSSMSYSTEKKGTDNFAWGVQQFQAAPQAAALALFSGRPRAIFAVAGNGGTDSSNPDYGQSVREWQADYQDEAQRVTGYADPIPMFHSQISEWTCPTMGANSTAAAPTSLLAEAETNPAKTILVCPRYPFPHAVAGASFPGLHLSNVGNRWLGEYYAKAYKKVVVDGGVWTPLKPQLISRSGAVITAKFDVPVPPLVLDPTLVSNPGNYGFEYSDDSGSPPTISSVTPAGSDTVTITLSAVPTGTNKRLRYAFTGVPGNPGGPTTGPRGNLRDSDATTSLYGNTLYNWCVHFDKPVN
jgi:hypothetical protein